MLSVRSIRDSSLQPTILSQSPQLNRVEDAVAGWEGIGKIGIEWLLVGDEDISDVDWVFERVESRVRELAADFRLIMHCASAAKPVTIAFCKLVLKYHVPLVYVYEQSRNLV